MTTNETPYANLDPSVILNAIESIGIACSGSLFALNSYENRVYQIGIDDQPPVIAKFYRPNRWSDEAILEEHRFAAHLVELEIPVVAPLEINGKTLHHSHDYRFALFPRKGGRALELDNMEQLEWMGRFVGRLHAIGACERFKHRKELTVASYGEDSYRFLMENHFIPDHLKNQFTDVVSELLQKIQQQFLAVSPLTQIRLHGDCHPGNVLWSDTGPHIVDLDDCLMGPAIQDIWMLLSGNQEHMQMQLQRILHGYYEFHDFNFRETYLIESLRTLRMLHYSAWLAKRWNDPAFPLNFPWFNTVHYWQEQVVYLAEQIPLI